MNEETIRYNDLVEKRANKRGAKKECEHCFHGWNHDVEQPDGSSMDEECWFCDGTGFVGDEDAKI